MQMSCVLYWHYFLKGDTNMNKLKKVIAIVLCLAILVLPTLAEMYVVENAEHTCVGEECPICMEIHMAIQIVNNLSLGVVEFCAITLVVGLFIVVFSKMYQVIIKDTLISLKVELLN